MTTKYLTGSYPGGYKLSPNYSNLVVESSASVRGAGITVVEPWAGYGRLNAKDVIDRARTANVAELAAMRLYEARHRARQTVLAAVDRQLALANGGRPA